MKIPKAIKLPSGNWRVQVRREGVAHSITAPTKDEAERQAAIYITSLQVGDGMRHDMTVSEAIDVYICSLPIKTSPATIRGYRTIQRNRFRRVMGRRISQIKSWQLEINREAEEVSPKTLRNAWTLVAAACRNVGYPPPKVKLPEINSPQREYLRSDELVEFCAAIRGAKAELPALLALHSLRRSELCALRWRDIDFFQHKILVRGAVVPDEHGKFVRKKETKNATSRRDVPIVIPRLEELLRQNATGKSADDFVITCSPTTVTKRIKQACIMAADRGVTTHGLRVSFATVFHRLGVDKVDTMHMGGWANLQTMTKIYTRIEEDAKTAHMEKAAEFFRAVK